MAHTDKPSGHAKSRRVSAKLIGPGALPRAGLLWNTTKPADVEDKHIMVFHAGVEVERQPWNAVSIIYTGIPAHTEFERMQVVRRGLPVSAVDRFVEYGAITAGEVYEVILPRKTLSNRRVVGTLTADQSDRLARVARVIAKAEETFGNKEKAARWLRRPTAPLNGEEPLKLLDTEAGARLVEELLIRIDHGIAA